MKQLSTKKMAISVSIMLAVSISLFIQVYRETAHREGEYAEYMQSCRTNLDFIPGDIIQIGNEKYAAQYTTEHVWIWKSQNGCTWTEIEPYIFKDPWLLNLKLCKTLDNQVGIVWQETSSKETDKSRTTFFYSIHDGTTWLEPNVLFHRDQPCTIKDVMVLDGGLLVLWEERLYLFYESEDRTVRGSGCDVVYRAYISEQETIIERVIEPENEKFCKMEAFAFLTHEERIWCIFSSGDWNDVSLYRSWSIDGKTWGPPELCDIPDVEVKDIFSYPDGSISIVGRKIDESWTTPLTHFFVCYSKDWEQWSVKKLLTLQGYRDITLAEAESGIWGFPSESDGISLIQFSGDLYELPSEKNLFRSFYFIFALFSLLFAMLIFLWWVI